MFDIIKLIWKLSFSLLFNMVRNNSKSKLHHLCYCPLVILTGCTRYDSLFLLSLWCYERKDTWFSRSDRSEICQYPGIFAEGCFQFFISYFTLLRHIARALNTGNYCVFCVSRFPQIWNDYIKEIARFNSRKFVVYIILY